MKITNQDWSEESKPLVKSPANQEMDIIQKECSLCGQRVQVIAGTVQPHNCTGSSDKK